MASLIEQLEMLDRQKCDLMEKIRQEEERKKKLAQDASIERLEALIEPITQKLQEKFNHGRTVQSSLREIWEAKFVQQCNQSSPPTKYQSSHMLANEEIFVTLLGIIKKQDARISELEANKEKNNVYQGPHAGESWNYM